MTLLLTIVSSLTPIAVAVCVVVRDRLKLSFLRKIVAEHGVEHLASAAAAVQTALGASEQANRLTPSTKRTRRDCE